MAIQSPQHTKSEPHPARATILLIDDEELFREILREGLEEAGYVVLEGVNGRSGLECFRKKHPDLVLCDLRMPEMDGLAVLAAIGQEDPGTPVIVVSGAGQMVDVLQALRLGAWDYIVKPVELEVLRHSVGRALERRRLLHENRRYRESLEDTVRQRTLELQRRTDELENANTALRHQIQERKRVEKERAHLEAELRQAQKMEAIGTLASGVAHDFNNLLTAIIGNLTLLREAADSERVAKYITEAEHASMRATGLVRQMLALGRKSDPDVAQIDVNQAVDEIGRLVRETFDRRIEFVTEKAAELPPVLADPAQVNSLLLNLCVNARDAVLERLQHAAGSELPPARITLQTGEQWVDKHEMPSHPNAAPGWYVSIAVADTGVGMPVEVKNRIFEPFYTTKPVDKGTGLGLSVVYGIVRQLSGWIDVQSEYLHGSTFTVYLPVAQDLAMQPPSDLAYRASAPGGTETLLLVDDEAGIREISEEYLTRLGYTVLLAADGQEGLRVFEREKDRIDLLILDLSMPKVSGNEMLRSIRQVAPHLKAIVSSGSADAPSHVTEKVDAFVLKPFRPTELAEKIREARDAK
ncbi:MAG: response regulator [Candidatus Hydrogenedentes bacterium]|nr:response regulator [Candidatus Hydrogenedentota bacterium]